MTITKAQAALAAQLLGVALRSVVRHGADEEGNEYDDIDDIESVIAALNDAETITIT